MSDHIKKWHDDEASTYLGAGLDEGRVEVVLRAPSEIIWLHPAPDQAREIAAHLLKLADLAEGGEASEAPCEHKSRGYVDDGGGHRDPYCYDCGEWL